MRSLRRGLRRGLPYGWWRSEGFTLAWAVPLIGGFWLLLIGAWFGFWG